MTLFCWSFIILLSAYITLLLGYWKLSGELVKQTRRAEEAEFESSKKESEISWLQSQIKHKEDDE